MTATPLADAQQERANRMYWNSTDTVDRIAEQLGMSRTALYSSVRPAPAGAECPDCGDGLVFPNRTSRTAGRAMCLVCDHRVAVADLPPAGSRADQRDEPAGYEGRDAGYGEGRRARPGGLREGLAAVEPQRAVMIGGAAVMGAVAGVAAVNLLRRYY